MTTLVFGSSDTAPVDWTDALYGEPEIVRPGQLIYLVSATFCPEIFRSPTSGPESTGQIQCYDGGIPLTREEDYASAADMLEPYSYPSPGCFRLYFTSDATYVRLGSTPVFEIRMVCFGYQSTGQRFTAQAFLEECGIDAVVHGDIYVEARLIRDANTTYLDVLNDAAIVGPWAFGFNRQDEFDVVMFRPPTGDPVITFEEDGPNKWDRIRRALPAGAEVPVYKLTLDQGETWPCETAGGASATMKDRLSRTPWYQSWSHEVAATLDKHAMALTASVQTKTRSAQNELAWQGFRDRYMALFGVERETLVLDCALTEATLQLDLNDVVMVKHARMDLADGKLFRIIAQRFDLAARRATFTLWG